MAKTETIEFRGNTYNVNKRDAELIAWILVHGNDIPEIGNLNFNLGLSGFTPDIKRSFEPVKTNA